MALTHDQMVRTLISGGLNRRAAIMLADELAGSAASTAPVQLVLSYVAASVEASAGTDFYPVFTKQVDEGGTDATLDAGGNLVNLTAGVWDVDCWWTFHAAGAVDWTVYIDGLVDASTLNGILYASAGLTVPAGTGQIAGAFSRRVKLAANAAVAPNVEADGQDASGLRLGLAFTRVSDLPN